MSETLTRAELKGLVVALNTYNDCNENDNEGRVKVLVRDTDEDIEDRIVDCIEECISEDKNNEWLGDLPSVLTVFAAAHGLLDPEQSPIGEDDEEDDEEEEVEDDEGVDDDDDDDDTTSEEEAEDYDEEDEGDDDDDAEDDETPVPQQGADDLGILLVTVLSDDTSEKTKEVFFTGNLVEITVSTKNMTQRLSFHGTVPVAASDDDPDAEEDTVLDGIESLDEFKGLLRQANGLKSRASREAFILRKQISTEDEMELKTDKQLGFMLTGWAKTWFTSDE